MFENIFPIIPFLIVISSTILSGKVINGLIAGIIAGTILASHGSFYNCMTLLISNISLQLHNKDSWFLYTFLIILPSLIELFLKTGSAEAFARTMTRAIKGKRGIEFSAMASSFCLSIDDYLSILTTGNVIRSLTDKVGIARVKLAYLIHALSGPVVILMPISSWVATLTAYLKTAGINNDDIIRSDPFTVYLHSIAHTMYSLITMIMVGYVIVSKTSYGPMKQAETSSMPQEIFKDTPDEITKSSSIYLFGPLLLLLVTIIGLILYTSDAAFFGGTKSLIEAFKQNSNIFFILASASCITFVCTSLYFWYKKLVTVYDCFAAVKTSFNLMHTVLLMIFLLSIFSHIARNELKTGEFLAAIAQKYISVNFMPLVFFITAIAIAFSTGTSWGTFGLLLPIGIPMLLKLHNIVSPVDAHDVPLLYQTIGAIFSGAICGDHLSLFSETTIMSAAATQVTPEHHFKTQLPYGIPVIISCIFYFMLIGLIKQTTTIQYILFLTATALLCISVTWLFNRYWKN